jgi:Sulfotransferase family
MPVIVGSPRSGTTLLRLMLDSHPELAIPPETSFLTLGLKLRGRGDKLREKFFRMIVNYPEPAPSWPDFEVPEEDFRAALMEVSPFNVPEGYRAFYRLYAARFGKSRWGDKTPLYCLHLDTVRRTLPEARFIHVIRDGRDAALSLRRMWFSPGREIETQAAYWRKCVLAARRAGLKRPDYLEVRYEDLILNARETLERICAHVSLDYDDAMLSYYTRAPARLREHKGRSRPDGTTLFTQEQRLRQQERTTEPPDPACVFAWKRTMSADERRRFQRVAGGLLEDLGYEV